MPKIGDALLYSGDWTNPIDVAIMSRTASQIVHIGIVTEAIDGPQALLSARSNGIVYSGWSNYTHVFAGNDDATLPRFTEAMTWLKSQAGKPYGWADILNQALELVGKDPVLLDKSFDCSHLVCCYFWIAGLQLDAWMIEENRVTPGDLYRWADAHGFLFTKEQDLR